MFAVTRIESWRAAIVARAFRGLRLVGRLAAPLLVAAVPLWGQVGVADASPVGSFSEFKAPVAGNPWGIATDSDGNVWLRSVPAASGR